MFRTGANIPEQPKVPPMPSMAAEFDQLYLEKCKEVNELERKVENFKSMAEIAVRQKQELENRLDGQKKVITGLKAEALEYRDTIRRMEAKEQEALADDLIRRSEALRAVDIANSSYVILPALPAGSNHRIMSQFNDRYERALELINEIPAVSSASTIRELAAEPLKGFISDVEPPEELPEELMEELSNELVWELQTVSSQDILCLSSALRNLYDIKQSDSVLLFNKLLGITQKAIDQYSREE